MTLSAQPTKPAAPQPYLNRRDVMVKSNLPLQIFIVQRRWHIAGCIQECRR